MKVIKETVGNTTIFIQTMEMDTDDEIEIIGETWGGRATQTTSIHSEVKESYAKVKSALKDIAEDIGAELVKVRATARPKEVEMEFNMGISAELGPVLILSGKGEYGLRIKMIWELGSHGRTG